MLLPDLKQKRKEDAPFILFIEKYTAALPRTGEIAASNLELEFLQCQIFVFWRIQI
jgi:hypothetical protein